MQWNPHAGNVDYATFTPLLAGNLAAHSADALAFALALYRGEFLAGLALEDAPEAELWLVQERAHVHALYERGALELIRRWSLAENWEPALRQTRTLLEHSPLLEPAHERLIWLYAQTGQTEAAHTHYEQYRQHLQREMGLEPAPELARLLPEKHPRTTRLFEGRSNAPPPFAGREAELRQIHQPWQAAQKGQGGVLLIEGEAGAGKSALVAQFIRQYGVSPALTGNGYEAAQHLPYTPWIELLEQALAHADPVRTPLPVYIREALGRFLPGSQLDHTPAPPPTDGSEAARMFQAITDGLLTLFQDKPLFLFMDNLQWADEASLSLFHFAARRAARARWLIVATLRPRTGAESPALGKVLEGLSPHAGRLTLSGLPSSAISELTVTLWPHLPAEKRDPWTARLQQATGGNPFFVCELLRELAARGAEPDHLPVPASVRELVQHRLQALPASGSQVLGALAVLDTPASPRHLHRLCERSEGETLDVLDEGWQRGLLRADEAERYAFAHDLVREAVVAGMSPARRRRFHARAALLLAEEAASLPPHQRGELAGRIVQHAQAGDDPERVFAWGREAASYATRLNAFGDALRAIEAACQVYPRLPDAEALGTEAREIQYLEILLDRARLFSLVNNRLADESEMMQKIAALLARHPHPEMQAMYHLGKAALLAGEGKYEEAIPAALNSYEHFMDLENWLGAAWSLHAVGSYKITLSQNQLGRKILAEALTLYQTSGDLTGEVTCLSSLAWVDLNLGEVRQAIEALTRARELTQQAGDALGQARISHTLAATWNFLYHTEQTEIYAQEAFDLFQKMGLPASRPMLYLATSAWIGTKDPERGRAFLLQAYTEAVEHNDLWLRGWAAQLLGRAALQAGDWTEAETRLEEAARLRRETGERANQVSDLAWLGRLRLARGDVPGALSLTERAVSEMETLKEEAWVFEAWDIYRAHAKVLVAQGNPEEAARFEQLAQEAEVWMAAQAPDEETWGKFWTWVEQMRLL